MGIQLSGVRNPSDVKFDSPELIPVFSRTSQNQQVQQPTQTQQVIPELYQTKSFDREAKLREMYGTNASKRDIRRFNKYWDSDQRWEDQNAFEAEEHKKYMDSMNARFAAIHNDVKAKSAASIQGIKDSLNARTPIVEPTPVSVPKPATKPIEEPIEDPILDQGTLDQVDIKPEVPQEQQTPAVSNWKEGLKRRSDGVLLLGNGWRDRYSGGNFYNYNGNNYRIVVKDDNSYLLDLVNGRYIQADENMWGRINDQEMRRRLDSGAGWMPITRESGVLQYNKVGGTIKQMLKQSNVFPFNLQ